MDQGGELNLERVTIDGSTSFYGGGSAYIGSNSIFNMINSTILNSYSSISDRSRIRNDASICLERSSDFGALGGSAICLESNSTALIENSTISSSYSLIVGSVGGGAIFALYSKVNIVDSVIQSTFSCGLGSGGIFTESSDAELRGVLILNNTSTHGWLGGGISFLDSNVIFDSVSFVNNSGNLCGGLYLIGSSTLAGNDILFHNNKAVSAVSKNFASDFFIGIATGWVFLQNIYVDCANDKNATKALQNANMFKNVANPNETSIVMKDIKCL